MHTVLDSTVARERTVQLQGRRSRALKTWTVLCHCLEAEHSRHVHAMKPLNALDVSC